MIAKPRGGGGGEEDLQIVIHQSLIVFIPSSTSLSTRNIFPPPSLPSQSTASLGCWLAGWLAPSNPWRFSKSDLIPIRMDRLKIRFHSASRRGFHVHLTTLGMDRCGGGERSRNDFVKHLQIAFQGRLEWFAMRGWGRRRNWILTVVVVYLYSYLGV